jgi:hypothetical protein
MAAKLEAQRDRPVRPSRLDPPAGKPTDAQRATLTKCEELVDLVEGPAGPKPRLLRPALLARRPVSRIDTPPRSSLAGTVPPSPDRLAARPSDHSLQPRQTLPRAATRDPSLRDPLRHAYRPYPPILIHLRGRDPAPLPVAPRPRSGRISLSFARHDGKTTRPARHHHHGTPVAMRDSGLRAVC